MTHCNHDWYGDDTTCTEQIAQLETVIHQARDLLRTETQHGHSSQTIHQALHILATRTPKPT
jgi:hypothetical protein